MLWWELSSHLPHTLQQGDPQSKNGMFFLQTVNEMLSRISNMKPWEITTLKGIY